MKSTVVSVARKLKLYQLVVFDQVLRSGSLVGAAQALNLTQPAVTKIIHELEAFLGAALLVRGNRGVRATELGGVVVRRAHAMLTELRSLTDEVNAYRFEGTRFDCGTHLGLVEATIRFALESHKLGKPAREKLAQMLAEDEG